MRAADCMTRRVARQCRTAFIGSIYRFFSIGGTMTMVSVREDTVESPTVEIRRRAPDPLQASAVGPCFLVASPNMRSDAFDHTVVLLVDHREEGSLGFIINRAASVTFADVMEQVGCEERNGEPRRFDPNTPVMHGGPVSQDTGWVLFDPEGNPREQEDGLIEVTPGICVTANIKILQDTARGDGPQRMAMVLGYAGWGPGQLDEEISDGAWLIADLDPELLFSESIERRWSAAFEMLGVDPGRIVGGANQSADA